MTRATSSRGTERLCDVVIATDLQPEHTVDFVVPGGEEEDRNIGRFADFPADVEAVEFRHADIEHDEIGPIAGEAGQRLLAVARLEHGHAGFFERDADDLADMKVIVDDKDTVRQSLLRKIAALNQAIAVSLEPLCTAAAASFESSMRAMKPCPAATFLQGNCGAKQGWYRRPVAERPCRGRAMPAAQAGSDNAYRSKRLCPRLRGCA